MMDMFTYYTTAEDGLVRYDWQKRKHEPIIHAEKVTGGGHIIDSDEGKFLVHENNIFFSNSHFTYLFDLKTAEMYGLSNLRIKNLHIADGYLLFVNMDDRYIMETIRLEDIKTSKLSSWPPNNGLSAARVLLNSCLRCYGKHPYRDESVVFYTEEGTEGWAVKYKTLDGQQMDSYYSFPKESFTYWKMEGNSTKLLRYEVRTLRTIKCVNGRTPIVFAECRTIDEKINCRFETLLARGDKLTERFQLITQRAFDYYYEQPYGFAVTDSKDTNPFGEGFYAAYSLYPKNDCKMKFVVISHKGEKIIDKEVDWCGNIHSDGKYFFCRNYIIDPQEGTIKIFSNNNVLSVQTVIV